MRKIGSKVVDDGRKKTLKEYEDNEKIFEGEHYEVFRTEILARLKKSGYDISKEGFFQMPYINSNGGSSLRSYPTDIPVKSMFVSENIMGSGTKTIRNFLFGENVVITSKEDFENLAIEDIMQSNDMYNQFLRGCISQAVTGFAAYEIMKENNEVSINFIESEYVIVNARKDNKYKIDNIEIAYLIEEDGKDILKTRTHYKGYYELHDYEVKENKIISEIIVEGRQEKYETGIDKICVVICNNEINEDFLGCSDYTEASKSLQREIDIRLTESAMALDKTQNPMMKLPKSIQRTDPKTKESYVDIIGKGILVEEGETDPAFIEFTGNFTEVENIIDNRRQALYNELGVVSALYDTEKLGNSSGTALKIKLMPTLAKVLMKKNQWEIAIKEILNISYYLLFGKYLENISFKWYDGIPVDRREEAEISRLRVGTTQSAVSSIMEQDNKTEEDAMKEYDRILQEEKDKTETMMAGGDVGGV